MTQIVMWGVLLGLGTFGFRIAGVQLKSKLRLSERTSLLITAASVILLLALIASSTLVDGDHFAGWARPAGVAVGGVLAWRKAPFVVVVLAAAAVAAGLRLIGVE
jgi:branched-subunit amino acid transport protein